MTAATKFIAGNGERAATRTRNRHVSAPAGATSAVRVSVQPPLTTCSVVRPLEGPASSDVVGVDDEVVTALTFNHLDMIRGVAAENWAVDC